MPGAKRRKLGVRALNKLTMAQKAHLEAGHYFFDYDGARDRFADDAHRRQAWAAYREQILADWRHPGKLPSALWQYDRGPWERHGESEAAAVYRLLEAAELEGCRLAGAVRIASEIDQIEADWLHEIKVFLGSRRDCPLEIDEPLTTWGCPPWFYRGAAPRILAEQQAEAARWRASLGRP